MVLKFISAFVDNDFAEPKDITALVILLVRDISRMGYLAKQAFEVLEINEEKAIGVEDESEGGLNDSFKEPGIWNRMTSIYEVITDFSIEF